MNNLYNQLNQNSLQNQFNQFRNTIKGDPRQMVQDLLNSGRMTQAQYNELSRKANELMKYVK